MLDWLIAAAVAIPFVILILAYFDLADVLVDLAASLLQLAVAAVALTVSLLALLLDALRRLLKKQDDSILP